jgi:hypothetical protein
MNGRRSADSDHRPVRSTLWRFATVLVLPAFLAAAAGCSGPGADQASETAQSFQQLASNDSAQACGLLAPKTLEDVEKSAEKPCAEALGDEDLADPSALVSVDVFGHDAIVRFANDTVFLARFPEGWRVTAASCRPGPSDDKPYDCVVSGG